MKTAFKTTKVVPDFSQLEKSKVLVKCNSCRANYHFLILPDLAKNNTKCPWCERVQAYTSAPLSDQVSPIGGIALELK